MDDDDAVHDFALPDQDGHTWSTADHRGEQVVVFFYPKAMTPGCTREACDFRDREDRLVAAGYRVVGVSPDPPARNRAFADREGLGFPLLSDEDHAVAERFGAWGTKRNYGREYEGLIRSTIVLDGDGRVAHAFRNVRAKGHVDRVLRTLGIEEG